MSDVDLQLRMVLSLDQGEASELPPCPLYYEVWSFEGDVDVLPRKWCTLINTCFPEREPAFDEQQFVDEFSSQPQFEPKGFFMVSTRSEVVGTAFSWQDNPDDPSTARLHWLAVHPEHRGKGLGKLLVSLVVNHFRQRGHHSKVTLRTQGHRIAAIRLYESLGFVIDPEYGDAKLCGSPPLRIVQVPAGAFLGFKACPGRDATQMFEHCASRDGISASKDPVWSGIYIQLSLAQSINYLPNQFERPLGHPLYLHERLASIVELSVMNNSTGGLIIAISDDPRMADSRVSNHDKAWLIFKQMRRTWPDDDGIDMWDLWSRLKEEDTKRKQNLRVQGAGAGAVGGGDGAYAVSSGDAPRVKSDTKPYRPVVVMDTFARKNMALCLMDAENYELCLPHALFHTDVLQTKTLLCFPESEEAAGCIGNVDLIEDEARQDMDASAFATKLHSRLSNKWDLFDASRLSQIVQDVFVESGSTVRAAWFEDPSLGKDGV